jgi:hypothetical protein
VDNNKLDFREIEWNGMDWNYLAHYKGLLSALVNTVINLWFPQNAGKFLSSCIIDGFSGRAQLCDE